MRSFVAFAVLLACCALHPDVTAQQLQTTSFSMPRNSGEPQLAYSRDGKYLVVHYDDYTARKNVLALVDSKTKKSTTVIPARWTGRVFILGSAPGDGKIIAGRRVSVKKRPDIIAIDEWDVKSKKLSRTLTLSKGKDSNGVLTPLDEDEGAAAVLTHDGKHLILTGAKGATIYDLKSGMRVGSFTTTAAHPTTVFIALSADGKWLVGGQHDTLTIWNLATKKQTQTVKIPASEKPTKFTAIAVSHDGAIVSAASVSKQIYVWNAVSGKRLHQHDLSERVKHITFLGFAAKTPILVIACQGLDPAVFCWDVKADVIVGKLDTPGPVGERPNRVFPKMSHRRSAVLSPDGKTLATLESKGVQFWTIPEKVVKKK